MDRSRPRCLRRQGKASSSPFNDFRFSHSFTRTRTVFTTAVATVVRTSLAPAPPPNPRSQPPDAGRRQRSISAGSNTLTYGPDRRSDEGDGTGRPRAPLTTPFWQVRRRSSNTTDGAAGHNLQQPRLSGSWSSITAKTTPIISTHQRSFPGAPHVRASSRSGRSSDACVPSVEGHGNELRGGRRPSKVARTRLFLVHDSRNAPSSFARRARAIVPPTNTTDWHVSNHPSWRAAQPTASMKR